APDLARRSSALKQGWSRSARRLGLRLLVGGVTAERPRRRELSELVADHVLGDEHGHELAPVVDVERKADHLGDDRGATRPGLDDPAVAALRRSVALLEQVLV